MKARCVCLLPSVIPSLRCCTCSCVRVVLCSWSCPPAPILSGKCDASRIQIAMNPTLWETKPILHQTRDLVRPGEDEGDDAPAVREASGRRCSAKDDKNHHDALVQGMRRAAGIPKMDTRKRLFHPTRTRQSQWGGRRRKGINPISQAFDKGPARHCTLVGVPLTHARPLLQPFHWLRADGTRLELGPYSPQTALFDLFTAGRGCSAQVLRKHTCKYRRNCGPYSQTMALLVKHLHTLPKHPHRLHGSGCRSGGYLNGVNQQVESD